MDEGEKGGRLKVNERVQEGQVLLLAPPEPGGACEGG